MQLEEFFDLEFCYQKCEKASKKTEINLKDSFITLVKCNECAVNFFILPLIFYRFAEIE